MRNLTPEQRAHLLSLEHKDRLTPTDVVEDAADDRSPLHALFEWDDGEAARQYRLDQARNVIRTIEVQITIRTVRVLCSAYVRDPDRGRGQGYVAVTSVTDDDRQRRVVAAETVRALGIVRRAASIARALGLDDGAEAVIEALEDWHALVEQTPQLAAAAD